MALTLSNSNPVVFARVEKIMSWCPNPSPSSSVDFLMTYHEELKRWKLREKRNAREKKRLSKL